MIKQRILGFMLILCLGLGLVGGVTWAQDGSFSLTDGSFSLTGGSFSQSGTGGTPLTSTSFQMQASVGQPGPVGGASSGSFEMTPVLVGSVDVAEALQRIYLPLVIKNQGP